MRHKQTTDGATMTGAELEQLVSAHLPEVYVRRALDAVFVAHRAGFDDAEAMFAAEEAANTRPYMKRGYLEGMLRDAAAVTPGMSAAAVKAPRGGWYHTEVRAGIVVLTQKSVPTPCAMVDMTGYRETLARSNQIALWGEPGDNDATQVYALLLHSRYLSDNRDERARYGHLPGSAYLAFPSADLDTYLHEINLFERYPEVVAKYTPQEWDSEAQVRYLYRSQKAATG